MDVLFGFHAQKCLAEKIKLDVVGGADDDDDDDGEPFLLGTSHQFVSVTSFKSFSIG